MFAWSGVTKSALCINDSSGDPQRGQLGLTLFLDLYDSLCVGTVVWKRAAGEGTVYGLKISHWSYLDPVLERLLPLHS